MTSSTLLSKDTGTFVTLESLAGSGHACHTPPPPATAFLVLCPMSVKQHKVLLSKLNETQLGQGGWPPSGSTVPGTGQLFLHSSSSSLWRKTPLGGIPREQEPQEGHHEGPLPVHKEKQTAVTLGRSTPILRISGTLKNAFESGASLVQVCFVFYL